MVYTQTLSIIECAVSAVLLAVGLAGYTVSRGQLKTDGFSKKNKNGAPFVSIICVGVSMTVLVVLSLVASDLLNFFLKVASVFWIIVYLFLHLDVIALRFKMPKVPRNFKVPGGLIIPVVGIIGDILMIYGIDNDWTVKRNVYIACIVTFIVLGVYSWFWVKFVMRKPLFKTFPIKEVMAMENEQFFRFHKRMHLRQALGIQKNKRFKVNANLNQRESV